MRAQICDTEAHAAITALVACAALCDPVRARSVRTLYPLVTASATGDGEPATRSAAALVALTSTAIAAGAQSAPLALAAERWMLHPGSDTAAELVDAGRGFATTAPLLDCERYWLAGAGLDAALDAVRRDGAVYAPAWAIALIGIAVRGQVTLTWTAIATGTTRDGLRRRIRAVDPDVWREAPALIGE